MTDLAHLAELGPLELGLSVVVAGPTTGPPTTRVMREERRTAVKVSPTRACSNPE